MCVTAQLYLKDDVDMYALARECISELIRGLVNKSTAVEDPLPAHSSVNWWTKFRANRIVSVVASDAEMVSSVITFCIAGTALWTLVVTSSALLLACQTHSIIQQCVASISKCDGDSFAHVMLLHTLLKTPVGLDCYSGTSDICRSLIFSARL